jgi:hypothetical protein
MTADTPFPPRAGWPDEDAVFQAHRALCRAIHILTGWEGTVQERLYEAYSDALFDLDPTLLNEGRCRKSLSRISHDLTGGKQGLSQPEEARDFILSLPATKALKIAQAICSLGLLLADETTKMLRLSSADQLQFTISEIYIALEVRAPWPAGLQQSGYLQALSQCLSEKMHAYAAYYYEADQESQYREFCDRHLEKLYVWSAPRRLIKLLGDPPPIESGMIWYGEGSYEYYPVYATLDGLVTRVREGAFDRALEMGEMDVATHTGLCQMLEAEVAFNRLQY